MSTGLQSQRQIICRIPHAGMSADEWGAVIQRELILVWTEGMPESEVERFTALWPCPMEAIPSELYDRLDRIIIHQAETLGWRMTLSEIVRFRMSEWEHHEKGPELFRKFGVATARCARVLQGKELPPIEDPDYWHVKNETVPELRLVLRKMRGSFAVMKKKPSLKDVVESFSKIVSESPGTYRHISAGLDRWQKFLEANPHVCRPIQIGDRTAPAGMYDEFVAWPSGWDPESVRQTISRLNPAKL
jgi:hypothetical protein